jgi:epoxyqueuosine reductase
VSIDNSDSSGLTKQIKNLFKEEGFVKVGISKAGELTTDKEHFRKWLKEERNADMKWLEKNIEKKSNPKLIDSDFSNVISAAYIYDTPFRHSDNPGIGKISKYAWGNADYHKVLKKKLKKICRNIESLRTGIKTKYYVDDGPIMEKAWAAKSGIGWRGKNSIIINPEFGSFFFLCTVLINCELENDNPMSDFCKSCQICMNACPTGALYEPYKLDANLCIAYHTIENENELPVHINLNGWVYGCDICQDVCPYNKHKFFSEDKNFYPLEKIFNKTFDELHNISEEEFEETFKLSPIRRTKFSGWKRNLKQNIGP